MTKTAHIAFLQALRGSDNPITAELVSLSGLGRKRVYGLKRLLEKRNIIQVKERLTTKKVNWKTVQRIREIEVLRRELSLTQKGLEYLATLDK